MLDAVEKGLMLVESDPSGQSVGIGGLPDRDGIVTLDASIMGPDGNAGSVCFLEDMEHPISVARMVMEKTPHVILAGDGALQFALENGFIAVNKQGETGAFSLQPGFNYALYQNVQNKTMDSPSHYRK